jgi:hypothetical protein
MLSVGSLHLGLDTGLRKPLYNMKVDDDLQH